MVSSQQGLTEVMIHRVSAQVHLIVGSTGPRSQQWLYLSSKICNWNRHSQQIAKPLHLFPDLWSKGNYGSSGLQNGETSFCLF